MIPKLFQILITSEVIDEDKFSSEMHRNIASFKAVYPEVSYALYDDLKILSFLEQNFERDVVAAYQALTPFAFKADLARYCLLYHFGGLYSDLSHLHLRPIELDKDTQLLVFRDMAGHPSWATSNAIIFAQAAHPVLKRAIDGIVAAHKAKTYGTHPLDVTGPYFWGRILATSELDSGVAYGDSRVLSQDKEGRDYSFKFMPGGEIVAMRNKFKNCSIVEFYGGSTNNYARLWHSREVWGERPKSMIVRVGDALRRSAAP
ncbi:MAG: glycosyltransferase family 32 protein [Shimia sp.]|uniref:glycosyltransferase family 32 protein n=1 Tax=Shimia sp. TaxID=1954381 RepID=UPI004059D7B4